MTRVGIQRLARFDVDAEVVEAVDGERRAERDREQDHREGPDQVEEARDEPVGPAAEVAADQREHDGENVQINAEPIPILSELLPP